MRFQLGFDGDLLGGASIKSSAGTRIYDLKTTRGLSPEVKIPAGFLFFYLMINCTHLASQV